MSDLACLGDQLWVLQRAEPPLLVFDGDGALVGRFGAGEVFDGHGLSADGKGGLLLVDRDAQQVLRVSPDGRVEALLGERFRPAWQTPFNHPTSTAIGPDGSLWVADGYGNARVHRFTPDGRLLLSFGELGTAPGQFVCPHGIAVTGGGRVLVNDRDNDRIQVFDEAGTLLDVWTGFLRPMAIAIGPDGWVYVTDQVPSLTRIAADGKSRSRARPARNMPHGMAIAADGTIYLTEMAPSSLVRLRPLQCQG
ncbi:MAG: hypothetical protein EA356_13880 [Geminicoccaceae bacterium]|nr:MAG: hypothetical protein EA356_13880 [Geminicoccaceae bacterium]